MTIVYQAYGIPDPKLQTLFSLISLFSQLKKSDPLDVVIYTDEVEIFQDFFKREPRVRFQKVTPEQIRIWRGAIDFVHRVKIEILQDAGKKFPGPLFYCDSDTYFKKSPMNKFALATDRISLMHMAEGSLGKGESILIKKMQKFVKNKTFDLVDGPVRLGPETVMWNAGVIGLSEKNKSLFPKIIQLTDKMHAEYPKHVTEQLAVSYFLQKKSEILDCMEEICHYWDQKAEFQEIIEKFLKENLNYEMALINFSKLKMPLPKPAKRNLFQKLIDSIHGK